MVDVTASDLNRGPKVKWYVGAQEASEAVTVTGAMVTAGGFALEKAAVYGLLVLEKNGVQIPYTGFKADGTTPATHVSGVEFIKYTGITADDVVNVYYADGETTPLKHVASAEDFKTSAKPDTETLTVHGQENKITVVGSTENSGSFSQLQMTEELKAEFVGARTTGPSSGEHTWSNKVDGFHTVGCLVGIKRDTSGNMIKKWAMMGVTFSGMDQDFPNAGTYTDSFNVNFNYLIIWEAA